MRVAAITLPVRTPNPSNGSHGSWRVEHRRRKALRRTAMLGCPAASLPCVVRLTRLSAGSLDEHDNLRSALKAVVDGCADRLGIKDNDPRVRWEYAQERTKRGTYGVRIEILAADVAAANDEAAKPAAEQEVMP